MIIELHQGVHANVNTFDGHIFYASSRANGVRAEPRRMVITSSQDHYVFEPDISNVDGGRTNKGRPRQAADEVTYENMNRDVSVNNGLHPQLPFLSQEQRP